MVRSIGARVGHRVLMPSSGDHAAVINALPGRCPEQLVEDYTANTRVSAGRVLAAVARAEPDVLDGYRVRNLDARRPRSS
jgi:hypothetical protein